MFSQNSLCCQQLSQQHGTAGSAAQGVVAHAGELVVKQGVLAQAADADSHAVLGVAIQLGLRTIRLSEVVQELLGCAGQVQLLCRAAEVSPGLEHLLLGGLLSKLTNTAAVWPSETGTRKHCAVIVGFSALTI